MMEFNARKLIKKGKIDMDCRVHFTSFWPEYDGLKGQINTDTYLSANEVIERYEREKEGINSSCDRKDANIEHYYDLLQLASDVQWYCGLE